MAQHDYAIANGTGAAVRSDLNNALSAIVTQNSGSTEPTTTYAYQMWADTNAGVMKIRNGANSAWITLYQLDGEWTSIAFENGSAAAPSIYFKDSGTDTGFFSGGTDQVNVTTGGTERVEWGTSEVVFNDAGNNYDFRVEGDTNANLLFVDASADAVGIGTSSPSTQLHVAGGRTLCQTGNEDYSLGISRSGATNAYYLGVHSSASPNLLFSNNAGTTRMVLTDGGSLGIGTTPSTLLHIQSTDPTFRFKRSDAGTDAYGELTTDTSGLVTMKCDPANAAAGSGFRVTVDNSETLRVDSSGRLLVGTSTSAAGGSRLQVEGTDFYSSSASFRRNSNDASGPALRLNKSRGTSAGSYTAVQSGDSLGILLFSGSDGTDDETGAEIRCEVDGTPGTNDMPGRLVFSTTADGASSPTERMRIDNAGNVLFISSSNKAGIDAGTVDGKYFSTTGARLISSRSATTSVAHHVFINGNGQVGSITTDASATAYNTSSDYRLKENVTAVTDGITRLQQLKPSRFNFIVDPDKTVDGFIAHEVQAVVPEAITGEKDAVDDEGNPQYQGIDQSKLVPLLTAALQEAIGRIETLEAEVAALKAS